MHIKHSNVYITEVHSMLVVSLKAQITIIIVFTVGVAKHLLKSKAENMTQLENNNYSQSGHYMQENKRLKP